MILTVYIFINITLDTKNTIFFSKYIIKCNLEERKFKFTDECFFFL